MRQPEAVAHLGLIPSFHIPINLLHREPEASREELPVIIPQDLNEIQTGMASWYGPGFQGKRTANGEIYNQHALTAAHPTLPLGIRAMVTNVNTGQSVEVRINDRGPYKYGRVIDLSYAAARIIGVWAPGTAPVRIKVLNADGTRPSEDAIAASAYAVLVASATDPDEADVLMGEVSQRYPDVYVSSLSSGLLHYYQVRLGPFRSRGEAARRAREVERDGLQALVVAEEDRRAER